MLSIEDDDQLKNDNQNRDFGSKIMYLEYYSETFDKTIIIFESVENLISESGIISSVTQPSTFITKLRLFGFNFLSDGKWHLSYLHCNSTKTCVYKKLLKHYLYHCESKTPIQLRIAPSRFHKILQKLMLLPLVISAIPSSVRLLLQYLQ